MSPLIQILIIDKNTKVVYSNTLKTIPLFCREHKSYVTYDADSDGFRCKKGNHIVFYDQPYELAEL